MFGGEIGGPNSETSTIDVNGLCEILLQATFNHDLLTDVPKGVCYSPSRHIAPKDMAHVFSGTAVASYVGKVPVVGKKHVLLHYTKKNIQHASLWILMRCWMLLETFYLFPIHQSYYFPSNFDEFMAI